MKILVTGGAGFIGSHLVEALLHRGDQVRVLDDLSTGRRDNLPNAAELVRGSVADPTTVATAMRGMEACFHLAAIASVMRCAEDWAGSHATNLGGTVAVLQAARNAGGVPVVYASSAAVYGDNPAVPLAETARPAPKSAYGADKLGSEMHAAIAADQFGVPTLGLRLFNVYGPRQDGASPYSGVISAFCDRLARGAPLTIWGGGGQTRDFVYVGDVVQAMLMGLARLPGLPRAINVCTGHAVSVLDVAAVIGGLCGVRPVLDHKPARAGDIVASCGDPTLLWSALGMVAATTLADGLSRTIDRTSLAA